MSTSETVILFVVVIFSFVLFNGAFLAWALIPTLKARKVQAWPTASGKIKSSEIGWRSTSDGSQPFPQVEYAYTVNGREYTSDGIMPGGSVGGMVAQRIVDKYPAGSTVTVYYNPDNPAEALLESNTPSYIKFVWMAIVFGNLVFCCCAGPGVLSSTGSNFLSPLLQWIFRLVFKAP